MSPVHKQVLIKMLYSIPLSNRKRLAIWVEDQKWFPSRHNFSIFVIRDWATNHPNEFHRFLWTNHLGYAKFYEENNAFGEENLIQTRGMLFQQLKELLNYNLKEVNSIFEVGCSSGYMLRYIEEKLFPKAAIVEGVDIDDYALEKGRAYLGAHSSKVRLIHADMTELGRVMNGKKYDLILCLGVLMYLKKEDAEQVVKCMIMHSKNLVAIADLAHPLMDNSKLALSEIRDMDGAHIHNIDKMVKDSDGKVVARRWEGSKLFGGQSVYFVFCQPE